jgi:hypothetical protein
VSRFTLKDERPCRLQLTSSGLHRFGGKPAHEGVVPQLGYPPLHLVLLLDLADPACPVESDGPVRYLPLYYPLKYGSGGPEVQYSVLSDSRIEILHISDEEPDSDDEQYVQVDELPSSPAQIIPLTYEEARAVDFRGGYFEPNADDAAILNRLNHEHPMISIGGYRRLPANAGDVLCQNRECEFFGRRVWTKTIASVPPVPVNGSDEFWYEYQGGYLEFCFCLCHYCNSVIAFNVAD